MGVEGMGIGPAEATPEDLGEQALLVLDSTIIVLLRVRLHSLGASMVGLDPHSH